MTDFLIVGVVTSVAGADKFLAALVLAERFWVLSCESSVTHFEV